MAGYPTLLEFQFMTADRPQFALGTGTEISDIRIQFTKWVLESRLVRACEEGEDYRFGFNGQEKVNEIAGIGNHMTATFWEYDTRLGRRWNIDPVVKPWESGYAVMGNNPIWNIDPNGDDFVNVHTKRKEAAKEKRDEAAGVLDAAKKDFEPFENMSRGDAKKSGQLNEFKEARSNL